jgi:hypothetical protein
MLIASKSEYFAFTASFISFSVLFGFKTVYANELLIATRADEPSLICFLRAGLEEKNPE